MNREEKAKRNKKAILSAIKRCLDRVAYSYISMQDVADEAGISKGGLRYYYPTKESLYMALIEDFFTEMDEDHLSIINYLDSNEDRAVLSTLFGIERFMLNQQNIKIFINLILYGLEDPKIMEPIRTYIRSQLNRYENIVEQAKSNMPPISTEEFKLPFKARIAQIIFLSAGLLETVDPMGMDPSMLTRYVLSLFTETQS
ncbi:MAG TPA: TetR/AcrR family transcriptional regulator [Spirochaetota bacterium]|nr:TetR/AcrR family transcriptional regulator [Spirochaetota bacterium]HNT10623.1 TetR/AcrR family transcriptional regulator [Spirochaetota bacterium]